MEALVIRSRRKTVSLRIREDGTPEVRAPLFMPEREIRRFVQQHQEWIRKQQQRNAARQISRSGIPPLTEEERKKLMKQAREDLCGRAAYYAPRMRVRYGRVTIRTQRSKWGSCSAAGNLNFNALLMFTPEQVRDYVVVHELAHRREMNHSPAFWAAVEEILPDYREARKWLKTHGEELMCRLPQAGD